jgi:predicted phosphodiesterase
VTRYLCVSDIHARKRPPSSCTDSYWPDLLDLLDQCVQVARSREVGAMVLAGDVFDHKAPSRTDHAVVRGLKEHLIWPAPCSVLAVAGNHDMQHDRIESMTETQPLGVLEGPGGLRLLEGWADDADGALEFPLYGVPWQQQWSQMAVGTALRDYTDPTGGEWNRPVLVVTHAPIYPPGQEPHYEGAEFTPASWWADSMGNAGSLLYGHIHEPHGVWQHGGVTFCNFGALSRGSLDEYNLHRQVGCTLWDDVTGEFEFVPLKARPAEEVFRLRQREQAAAAQHRLDGFLSGVSSVTLGLLNVESVLTHIRKGGHSAGVVNLAEELLTAQQGGTR